MKKINILIISLMFLAGIVLLPQLPKVIPMHWNIMGEVDNYMPKNIAVWILPVLTAVMFAAFQIVPSFDPKKGKYRLFKKEWEIIQTVMIGFFAYLQFIIFYLSLNPEVPMMPFMFIGIGSLFILFGNYLSKIRQNYFLGIKVPWTLASEDNWNRTHRFASWCFVIAGIVTLIEAC
ncbi:SdpI family protein, partial [Candidatus Microgenomates bacterium]|nr:SdpI family protein [Candidatus Microgenomates bacterium]